MNLLLIKNIITPRMDIDDEKMKEQLEFVNDSRRFSSGANFSCLDELEKLVISPTAPFYLVFDNGINYLGFCHNSKCETKKSNGRFIIPKGYGHFNIVDDVRTMISCKACSQQSDFVTIGLFNCRYSYTGRKLNSSEEITKKGVAGTDYFYKFNDDENNTTVWEKLEIDIIFNKN